MWRHVVNPDVMCQHGEILKKELPILEVPEQPEVCAEAAQKKQKAHPWAAGGVDSVCQMPVNNR
ncbi:MAG: hypothetical protein Tsb0026_16810 [Sulfuricaulis sp.]